MIDAEVLRLRKLRNVALRSRALAKLLDSDSFERQEFAGQSMFARSAVVCWTIARIASGRLRAHPYVSYQRGPSRLRDVADAVSASLTALNARRLGRAVSACAQQLQAVAREVNDARALTWSPELSDALGRMQIRLRRLSHEFDLRAAGETNAALVPRAKSAARAAGADSVEEIAADSAWPYLAI